VNEPEWGDVVNDLKGRTGVPAALVNAGLLESVRERWDGVVVARTSMHDLLFTLPGDPYPFAGAVRVSWLDGTFEFRLIRNSLLVTADRCREPNAGLLLDSFLAQLAGGAS
jgi:hypothetical protein